MGNLLAWVWIKPAYGIKQPKNAWKNKIIYTVDTKVKCRSTMELWKLTPEMRDTIMAPKSLSMYGYKES